MPEDNKALFEEFQEWKRNKDTPPTEKIRDFIHEERLKLKNHHPIELPRDREMIWILGIGGTVLLISVFPIIILGVIIGMAIIAHVGCDWFKKDD